MELADIETSVKTNPLGKQEAINYAWKGKSPYVRITGELVKRLGPYQPFPESLEIGPYKLLLIEKEPWIDCALYVRSDRVGALRAALYRSTRLLDLIYRHLIITLAVWQLADFHQGYIPTWRDIKALKRFAK